MKIFFVVSGTKRVAATRYRVYQYLSYFEKQGIRYRVFSITSDLLTRLAIRSPEFNAATRLMYYLLLFVERLFRFWVVFFMAPDFDIVFFQRAAFPFGLGRILRFRNKNIIFDIDDAIFLPDTDKNNMMTRFKAFVKEKEVQDMLSIARCVVVENDYIRDYVARYCQTIYKIPGPIDTDRYEVREAHPDNDNEIILGWIGSPATTAYLHLLDGVFNEILSRFKHVKVVLVGAGKYDGPLGRVIKKYWNYEKEVEELKNFDIGLMPMPDDKWTKGKLGCKMLQYMAVAVPSVVSYTSTNAEIIRDGENGFLVRTESEWVKTLSRLIEDASLRQKIGWSGRNTVEELCSVRNNAPKLITIFKSLGGYNEGI